MPNHISHIMTVDGDAKAVTALLDVLRSEPQDEENGAVAPDGNHYHLDFNKFIPRPPALDVESGSSSHWGMHFFRNPSECITDTDSFVARTAPVAAAALLEHGNKTNAEIAEILQQEVLPEWLGRVNTNGDGDDCARKSPTWRSRPNNSLPLNTACPGSVATSA